MRTLCSSYGSEYPLFFFPGCLALPFSVHNRVLPYSFLMALSSRPVFSSAFAGRDAEPLTPDSFFTSRNTDPRCDCGSRIPTATTAACSRPPVGAAHQRTSSGEPSTSGDRNNNKKKPTKKKKKSAISNHCDLLTPSH